MVDICIVTGCASGFGYGHVSRMISLLSLLDAGGYRVAFFSKEHPPFFPKTLRKYCVAEPCPCALLIRDLRDSTEEEILSLKKLCKDVLVIDDDGPGRALARGFDLLPRPGRTTSTARFIYGYNFVSYIVSINAAKTPVRKEYDLYLYGVSEELSDDFTDAGISHIVPSEGKVLFCEKSRQTLLHLNTAEAMSKSRFVLTHFGLSLFEAIAARSFVGLINPTEYHNTLCNNLVTNYDDETIHNYGTIDTIDRTLLVTRIKALLVRLNTEFYPAEVSRYIAQAHSQTMTDIAEIFSGV